MGGIGLAPKLMLSITLVSALLTMVVGYTLASSMQSMMREEIIKLGVDGVKMLGGFGRVSISEASHQPEAIPSANEFTQLVGDVTLASGFSQTLLNSVGDHKTSIQDAYVTVKDPFNVKNRVGVWALIPSSKATIRGKEVKVFREMGITVNEGTLEKDGTPTAVYEFVEDFSLDGIWRGGDDFKPIEGQARLFLSAERIREATNEVFVLMLIILGIAVLVSLGVAFFLARGITSPILRLVKDMSIVSGGDLEHKTKASSSDEVGYLSSTFNHLTQSLKTAHEAEIEKEKMEHDMQVGREIQQNLLPKSLLKIPKYDLHAYYDSAKEVGGDYYDLIPIDKTHLGVIVADVSGKGIQGAMIMTIMRTVMNIASIGNLSSKGCLARTNRFMADRIKRGMFVTAFYAILDCAKHELVFSSAGHNPMVVYRAKTNTIETLNPTGIAIGFDKGPLFERTIKESDIKLEPGDRFILYTDGVPESMNEAHEEFTDQRFFDFCLENSTLDSKTFVQNLVDDVASHQGKAPQHDDITIVTFRRLA